MKSAGDDRLKVAFLAMLVLAAELMWLRPNHEVERWFVPGELGHEPGIRPVTDRSRGFFSRDFSGGGSEAAHVWEKRNGKTASLSHGHNLAAVFPASLYDSHPEFFPLVGGQRFKPLPDRTNWQPDLGRPDVAAHAAEVAGDYFAHSPQAPSYSVAINDAFTFGESPETMALVALEDGRRRTDAGGQKPDDREQRPKANGQSGGSPTSVLRPPLPPNRWFRGRPDYSNLVFTFMNRATDDLSRTHPDKYLGGLAYYWAENAPDFPVNRQVLPFLTADRSQGYDPAFRAEEFALQEKWAAAIAVGRRTVENGGQRTEDGHLMTETGGQADAISHLSSALRPPSSGVRPPIPPHRLGMYDYLDGPGFLIPRIHTKLIAENIRHAWQSGFTDYYAEGEPNWGLDGPMHWLVAQLLQDPVQPEGALLDEYYRRYFEEAAGPMQKFFERCEEQWMHQPGAAYWLKYFRNEAQAEVFPSPVCRELRGYLDEAERLAERKNPKSKIQNLKLAERVRLVSAAFGVTERFVAMQEARDALNRRVLRAEDGRRRTEGQKAGRSGRALGGLAEKVEEITGALDGFLTARTAFLDYLQGLKAGSLPALAPFPVRDYTDHDPTVNALVVLGELEAAQSDRGKTAATSAGFHPSAALAAKLPRGWERLVRGGVDAWPDLCRNGQLEGPLLPGRRIAGLEYGVDLPVSWVSYVEPAERHRAVFRDEGSGAGGQRPEAGDRMIRSEGPASGVRPLASAPRILRLSGTTDTAVLQWNPAAEGAFYLAQVTMCGSVSPSCAATLTLGWLDAERHNLGWTIMRLPEGQWNEPLVLSQGAFPPPGAAYVGIGVRIEHQSENDWVEVSDFRLKISVPE